MGELLREVRPGLSGIGGKGQGLLLLLKAGLRVPRTWAIPYLGDGPHPAEGYRIPALLAEELAALPPGRYAVRSSADMEDSAGLSFAGQFRTVLNVEQCNLASAVEEVMASVREQSALAYLQKAGLDPTKVRMAVLVQEMVAPAISGVVFSSDPLTGAAEIVTEMIEGSGELLVQEGRTPARRISRRGSHEGTSLLPEGRQAELERAAQRMAALAHHPVDMEFVFDGDKVWFVQVREITALKGLNIYSNTFSKEFLPGMIKPLVWSINNPLVNGAWARLFGEMIGRKDLDPRSFGRLFYYRAYFNMTAVGEIWEAMGLPRDSLEGLMISGRREGMKFRPTPQVMALLPRLSIFVVDKLRFTSKLEHFMRSSRPRFERSRTLPLAELSDEDLARELDALFALNMRSAYYNIITILLTALYERLLKARLAKAGLRYEDLDLSSPGLQEHYPMQALAELRSSYAALNEVTQNSIAAGGVAALGLLPEASSISLQLDGFLRDFGHFSDSGNDFSVVPWAEDPDLVLRMAIGLGDAPPRRKRPEEIVLPRRGRWMTKGLLGRAAKYRLLRERMSSQYTLGYGLFRRYYLEIGRRLVAKGVLVSPDDIFYLYSEEVAQILSGGCEGNQCNNYRLRAVLRRREMAEQQDIILPPVIYGDVAPPLQRVAGESLSGVATSSGYYQGKACIVRGSADFDKVEKGDVIVIPYSDVGWTPLFSKAGAVVAEAGGLLSHSSIIAREYGIPAVVSVAGAMAIQDGVLLTVDGFKGLVRAERPNP